ncbi:hypothetical protein D3C71_1685190 [compost metagenome]
MQGELAGDGVTDFQRRRRLADHLREAHALGHQHRFARLESRRLLRREVLGLALGCEYTAGLAWRGLYGQGGDVECYGLVRGDQVAVTQAEERCALQGLRGVLGLAVGRHDQRARKLQVRQGGSTGKPAVGQHIDLQLHHRTDHHLLGGH